MNDSNYHVSDEMASDVLIEAARLHVKTNKKYSFTDLQQTCSKAGIPPSIVNQAISNVTQRRAREQVKRWNFLKSIKLHLDTTVPFLLGITIMFSVLVFHKELRLLFTDPVFLFNSQKLNQKDFYYAVKGKTKQEVIQTVGKPNSTYEGTYLEWWSYNTVIDSNSGKLGTATIYFKGGVVDEMNFNAW